MSYPRCQEFRRLSRAGTALVGSAVAAALALGVASIGAVPLTVVLFVAAMALGFSARHWLGLPERSRVGARSEDEVRRALAPLRMEGWRPRHLLQWRGRGDIDLVVIAPWGVGFAIEVKTGRYEYHHSPLVREQAAWLWLFRRRWCRHGVVPVVCVARARGVYRWEEGVLVVSTNRLTPMVRGTANLVHSA